jgi:hypothetical protein
LASGLAAAEDEEGREDGGIGKLRNSSKGSRRAHDAATGRARRG